MSRYLPVENPQNRFSSISMEYDDPDMNPGAPLEVYEDHSRTILASNDSPDVGFKWSVNPYRGCFHGCAYCLAGDTRITVPGGRARALADLHMGDEIYGTEVRGGRRRYVRTKVLAHWRTLKRAHRVQLADGTELVASGQHRFLTTRGWRYVEAEGDRPALRVGDSFVGFGALPNGMPETDGYRRGYVAGLTRGARGAPVMAVRELAPHLRAREYVAIGAVMALASGGQAVPVGSDAESDRGFLAGVFDACGSFEAERGALTIVHPDPQVLTVAARALRGLALDVESDGACGLAVRGGMRAAMRFFTLVTPASRRSLDGGLVGRGAHLDVKSITDLGFVMPMFDITTGTGDFIANGIVSHNCYARPTHEYLSLGAGSDFERKIIVKRNAPELLREAFEKKTWKGEHIVFSGITDCYQPLESKLQITRGCLEVCVEYKNPAGFITKSPVIERDVDLLVELSRVASCRVSVSIPFWDPDVARAIEPFVTTPARRLKIIETLAKAGVRVGVSVSPIVPGLNDEDIGDVLKRAADAGAKHAFFVLLRLPGAVKEVFETSLRAHLPLRAEKVLRRLREAHGGKLYDSTFGHRGRGSGVYAETISSLFENLAKRHGLRSNEMETWDHADTFERPMRLPEKNGQTSFGF